MNKGIVSIFSRQTLAAIFVIAISFSFILYSPVRAIDFSSSCPLFTTGSSGGGTGGGGTGGGGTGGGGGPSGAGATAIIEKACYYMKHPSEYKSVMAKTFTDCYGFVVTVVRRSGVDPNAAISPRAKDAISEYYGRHPEKYSVFHVTSSSQLKPGDLLFRTSGGSHASLYVGPGYCGCSGGVISASLGDHGPQCSHWYGAMSNAVRVK